MIITCNQCNKKFEVDSNLIPNEGRLLKCSSCDNTWFFKKNLPAKSEIKLEPKESIIEPKKIIPRKEEKTIDLSLIKDEKEKISSKKKQQSKKGISSFNFILIFIISFVALVIIVDTFKKPIISMYPDIEIILESLYEVIKDVFLFFKDLI